MDNSDSDHTITERFFITPQRPKGSSLFSSRNNTPNSLTRSVDRFIPIRRETSDPYRNTITTKKHPKRITNYLPQNSPETQEILENSDLKNTNHFAINKENDSDEQSDIALTSATDVSMEESLRQDSLHNDPLGNEDSFNVSLQPVDRPPKLSGSPCSASSKSAAKRARHELHSKLFLQGNSPGVWEQRVLMFNESLKRVAANDSRENRLEKFGREKREERIKTFPRTSEKVLDAPCVLKSRALNLMDWTVLGESEVLAVALSNDVYVWVVGPNQIHKLSTLSNSGGGQGERKNIGSVLWFAKTFLAVGRSNATVEVYTFHKFDSGTERKETKANFRPSRVSRSHVIELPKNPAENMNMVTALSWSKNLRLLVVCVRGGDITLHNFKNKVISTVARLSGPKGNTFRLRWSPLGDCLAAACGDSRCHFFKESAIKTAVAKTKGKLKKGIEKIYGVKSCGKGGDIHLGGEKRGKVKEIYWCPWKNDLLAVGYSNGAISIVDLSRDVGDVKTVSSGKKSVTGMAFVPKHRELLTSHGGVNCKGVMYLWAFPELTVLVRLEGHSRGVLGLSLSTSRMLAASLGLDETIRIWKMESNKNDELNAKRKTAGMMIAGVR